MDELGLVEAVDRLGQGIVIAIPDGADGCFDPGGDQRVGVGQRNVLPGFNWS